MGEIAFCFDWKDTILHLTQGILYLLDHFLKHRHAQCNNNTGLIGQSDTTRVRNKFSTVYRLGTHTVTHNNEICPSTLPIVWGHSESNLSQWNETCGEMSTVNCLQDQFSRSVWLHTRHSWQNCSQTAWTQSMIGMTKQQRFRREETIIVTDISDSQHMQTLPQISAIRHHQGSASSQTAQCKISVIRRGLSHGHSIFQFSHDQQIIVVRVRDTDITSQRAHSKAKPWP